MGQINTLRCDMQMFNCSRKTDGQSA